MTRFLIFEADQIAGGQSDMTRWEFVGTVEANDRYRAVRKHYGTPQHPVAAAVSEHAWQPVQPKVQAVIRGLETVAMPELP